MPFGCYSFLAQAAHEHYAAVARALADSTGLVFDDVVEPGLDGLEGVLEHGSPALLFLCGLPYVRARDIGRPLEPLAAPVAEGSRTGASYTSDLVVAPHVSATDVSDLAGCRMAYNGDDSLSGWLLPRSGLPPALYEHTVRSGSHRGSLELLLSGAADAAAVDSTLLVLEQRRDPRIARLRTLARVGPMPSPPVVLLGGDLDLAGVLRRALERLGTSPAGRRALALGAVERFEPVGYATYDPVRRLLAHDQAQPGATSTVEWCA